MAAPFWDSGVDDEEQLQGGADDQPVLINATYPENPFLAAWLDGRPVPGESRVRPGLTQIGIDNKKPDGADGSTITVKGFRPGEFEIETTIWTRAQWDALQALVDRVWRIPTKKAKLQEVAISVYHPALDFLHVNSCVIKAVTFPQDGSFEGSKVVSFKCQHNVPSTRKKRTKTAKATSPKAQKDIAFDTYNGSTPAPSEQKKQLGPDGPLHVPATGSH